MGSRRGLRARTCTPQDCAQPLHSGDLEAEVGDVGMGWFADLAPLDILELIVAANCMREMTSTELEACPADPAEAVGFLRLAGLSKVESIRALAQHKGLTLSEAKALVHTSEAWSDVRDQDDHFHDDLIVAATKQT